MVLGKIGGLFDNVRTVTASDEIQLAFPHNYVCPTELLTDYKIPIAVTGSIRFSAYVYGTINLLVNGVVVVSDIYVKNGGIVTYDINVKYGDVISFSHGSSGAKSGQIRNIYLKYSLV